jgi:DNA-binding NtrC family response regulator
MANVLIIDDDDAVREYLARLVTRLQHTAFTASNCEEGRKLMDNPDIQIIISDIYLPDSPNLTEWVGQLKTHAKGRPLILITGDASDELVALSKSKEIMAFLTKPFELAFIKNLLNQAMNA